MSTERHSDTSHDTLAATVGVLRAAHDLLLVDLDGVVFVGEQAVPGVADVLAAARTAGVATVFVTNNASRPPSAVSSQLNDLGIDSVPSEVMTSAIAAAAILAERVPAGSPVLVIGGAGVQEALDVAGLRPVTSAGDAPVAVVQGFAPEVGWAMLAEGAIAIRAGVPWLATNTDLTLPSPRGPLPGNGSLVAAVAAATGATPEVIGKPGPALYIAARREHRGDRPLAIGDRIDTDIAGAVAADLPSLLVLSGVCRPIDVVSAPAGARPRYLGRDLAAIDLAHPPATVRAGMARCGRFEAYIERGEVFVNELAVDDVTLDPGRPSPDGLDGMRALAVLAWSADSGGEVSALRSSFERAIQSLNLNL